MKDNIKYEDLSQGIKSEINRYYNNEKGSKPDFSMEDAMYIWFDKFFDKWMKENYLKNLKEDKRRYFRLDIEVPVRIIKTIIESSKEETMALDFVGTILNISRGGLYFKSKKHVEISSIIRVKINLSVVDKKLKEIEALAMVTRSEKIGKNDYGIGLMFSTIYDTHKQNLDLFIFRNVAHHIHLFNK